MQEFAVLVEEIRTEVGNAGLEVVIRIGNSNGLGVGVRVQHFDMMYDNMTSCNIFMKCEV